MASREFPAKWVIIFSYNLQAIKTSKGSEIKPCWEQMKLLVSEHFGSSQGFFYFHFFHFRINVGTLTRNVVREEAVGVSESYWNQQMAQLMLISKSSASHGTLTYRMTKKGHYLPVRSRLLLCCKIHLWALQTVWNIPVRHKCSWWGLSRL